MAVAYYCDNQKNMIKKGKIFITSLIVSSNLLAQDPHFTQFYAAPLTINPAYAGKFDGTIRVMTNFRQQWANLSSPITTSFISVDGNVGPNYDYEHNTFNLGIQFMNDRTMKGAFRSNYITATGSYNILFNRVGFDSRSPGLKSLGLGYSVTYANRKLDYNSLSFEQQFTSGGFDLSLPNGEASLYNMRPFITMGVGLLYTNDNTDEGSLFEIGVSAFNFNTPQQSILSDENERLPIRLAAHTSFKYALSEYLTMHIKALYQKQAIVEYVLGGISLAKVLGDEDSGKSLGAGLWYRSGDAFSPHVFMELNNLKIGLNYDITTSQLGRGQSPAKSYELSIQMKW